MTKPAPSSIVRLARWTACTGAAAWLAIVGFAPVRAADAAYIWVQDMSFSPRVVTVTQGAVVEWDFAGSGTQTVTGATGLRLFSSGPKEAGSSYRFQFVAAGNYLYSDETTHNTGKVKVPIRVDPRTRPLGGTFTVTWASAPPPPDYDYEVEVRWPGGSFSDWQLHTEQTSDTYQAELGTGKYQFRARMWRISSGKPSGWSPVATVIVT
jgi:plastocyanin